MARPSWLTWKLSCGGWCMLAMLHCITLIAQTRPHPCPAGATARSAPDSLLVQALSRHAIHIHVGGASMPTFVEDPSRTTHTLYRRLDPNCVARFPGLKVSLRLDDDGTILVTKADGAVELSLSMADANAGQVILHRHDQLDLYGMAGLDRTAPSVLTRNSGAPVRAGSQGDGGAPLFFTTRYGMLVGSEGGRFSVRGDSIVYSTDSEMPVQDVYVFVGAPADTMQAVADISGHAAMPPRWTLGFLHSLWGSDQNQILTMADTYREKSIPLNAFILDFDWKAWGEDNYGEWRWNSTCTDESFNPNLFPDGASGTFAARLRQQDVFLAGILKPRILLYRKGTEQLHQAAQYAQDHQLWYPDEPVTRDYFTRQPSRDLDFSKEETRRWYWEHLQPTFDTGIAGWWNDEADHTLLENGVLFQFNNLQFAHMGQALYEGQRQHSDLRVWSINRNFFLGAQRYGYAEWSGDIDSGWKSMQAQPARMLSTLNLGEQHWSMDIGGFKTDPTPENYARWIEFGALVPIMRVHGNRNLKRAPWAFGERAERAATAAIRLRSALFPYLYSTEWSNNRAGVGIVRPLLWVFPEDSQAAAQTTKWMLGDAILVSPVLVEGEKEHSTYLPAGEWLDYWTGAPMHGATTVQRKTDVDEWTDIPLYIRRGSIIALSAPKGAPASGNCPVVLDVFPSPTREAAFDLHEDDGMTYAYERGQSFTQHISVRQNWQGLDIHVSPADGAAQPMSSCMALRLHMGTDTAFTKIPGTRVCTEQESNIATEVSPDPTHVTACLVIPLGRRGSSLHMPLLPSNETQPED